MTIFLVLTSSLAAPWPLGRLASSSYLALWAQWNASCNPTRVLRRDGVTIDSHVWSLAATTLPLTAPHDPLPCSNVSQLRHAVTEGRRWASRFRPAGCSIPWYPPARARDVLDRFSHVLLVGDSMLATVASGLQLLVSGDFATGVLRPNASSKARSLCTCDGQLSSSVRCRSGTELSARLSWRPSTRANTSFAFVGHSEAWLRDELRELKGARGRGMTRRAAFASMCSDDPRPRFVVLTPSCKHGPAV